MAGASGYALEKEIGMELERDRRFVRCCASTAAAWPDRIFSASDDDSPGARRSGASSGPPSMGPGGVTSNVGAAYPRIHSTFENRNVFEENPATSLPPIVAGRIVTVRVEVGADGGRYVPALNCPDGLRCSGRKSFPSCDPPGEPHSPSNTAMLSINELAGRTWLLRVVASDSSCACRCFSR